jgi:glyoxylase-like metal-dependent hydrolase (beta-lactamase superfamily II)
MDIEIFPIRIRYDTVYAVRAAGVIVIDGGDPHEIKKFLRGIERASIKPEEIRLIVLTHGHWDHVGSAKEIKELTRAKILLHRADIHLLDCFPPPQPPGFTPWGKIIVAALKFQTRSTQIPAFEVDIVAGDEEISLVEYGIPGRVVSTPGHSWGSVSVILDSGEAFVGDLAMNMFPLRLSPGLPPFGDEIQIIRNSWRKLLDMGAKTVYPAHGKPFPVEILDRQLAK